MSALLFYIRFTWHDLGNNGGSVVRGDRAK